ncbi:hypothetical protein FACS189454_09270 [Planctomycetales bacterium]|nr:hypothetical protein FACS189454_09270 [Planctomycetales bacterium]
MNNKVKKTKVKTSTGLITVVVVLLLSLCGCREAKIPGLVPVEGIVTYLDEPLADATVGLTPKNYKSGDRIGAGLTDSEGRFSIRTIGEKGVLPNEYDVVVIKNTFVEPAKETVPQKADKPQQIRAKRKVKSLIPARYGNAKTSGLHLTVGQEGLRNVVIELTQ